MELYTVLRKRFNERGANAFQNADLYNSLIKCRHDIFGEQICASFDIPLRNDVDFEVIVDDLSNNYEFKLEKFFKVTPDNYKIEEGMLLIIDYKVSRSTLNIEKTLVKYNNAFNWVPKLLPIDFKTIIINLNPDTLAVWSNQMEFLDNYKFELNLDEIRDINDMLEVLEIQNSDDDTFMRNRVGDNIAVTDDWFDIEEANIEKVLENDVTFYDFKRSLDSDTRKLFEKMLKSNVSIMGTEMQELYKDVIKTTQQSVNKTKKSLISKLTDLEKLVPSKENIDIGWKDLETKLTSTKDLSNNILDAKPTVHMMISTIDLVDKELDMNNFKKCCLFGGLIKLMDWSKCIPYKNGLIRVDHYQDFFKVLGDDMDMVGYESEYNSMVQEFKSNRTGFSNNSKYQKKSQSRSISPNLPGIMVNDMQFMLRNFTNKKEFTKFCGIDVSKNNDFKKGITPEQTKPFCLSPVDESLKEQVNELFNAAKLSEVNPTQEFQKTVLKDYIVRTRSMDPGNYELYDSIIKTKGYKIATDISILIKNALSVANFQNFKTYRLIFSANKSSFLILLPSMSIKYAQSSICFISCCFTKKNEDIDYYSGCNRYRVPLTGTDFDILISNPIRLNKERAKRLVEAPFLMFLVASSFITTDCDVESIINYSFYSSLNITKSLMTLTEPARYILMGSSAKVSDVKSYIGEKFEPSLKTAFSIWIYNKIKEASYIANEKLKGIVCKDVFFDEDKVKGRGVKSIKNLPSIYFKGNLDLKGYLNEVFIPFYINSKGLHEFHHNIIDLTKVPCQIEIETKKDMKEFWIESENQYCNLPVFLNQSAKYYQRLVKQGARYRNNVETSNMFNEPIYKIPTMTSSKSCVQIGDFFDIKVHGTDKKVHHALKTKMPNTRSYYTVDFDPEILEDTVLYIPIDKNFSSKLFSSKMTIISTITMNKEFKVWQSKSHIGDCFKQVSKNSTYVFCICWDTLKDRYEWDAVSANYLVNCIKLNNNQDKLQGITNLFPLGFTKDINAIEYLIESKLIKSNLKIYNNSIYIFEQGLRDYTHHVRENLEITPKDSDNNNLLKTGLYKHHDYKAIRNNVKNYQDYITKRVFDRLYDKVDEFKDKEFIKIAGDCILKHQTYYSTLFCKDQRTAKDREIYEMELEGKILLYVIERLFKTYSREDMNEMISRPGDVKVLDIENSRNRLFTFATQFQSNARYKYNVYLNEINADMSKWSAKDLTAKYLFLIALNPSLKSKEKKLLILGLCRYMRKVLLLPDSAIGILLDQYSFREDDPIMKMTNNLSTNCVKISQNWFQGNLNYLSSFCHSIAMDFYKDLNFEFAKTLNIENTLTVSLVHSDDNQTGVCMIEKIDSVTEPDKMTQEYSQNQDQKIASAIFRLLEFAMRQFGFILNTKKSFISSIIKEFISMHNLNGEPFSVFHRFLFPVIGACSFLGPYEDLTARLSGIQTAIRHGCPPSLATCAIGCATEMTYATYNMLPGMKNDPGPVYGYDRFQLPLEIGGYPAFDLSNFVELGTVANDIRLLRPIISKVVNTIKFKTIEEQLLNFDESYIKLLNTYEKFIVKFYKEFCITDLFDPSGSIGETYEMSKRSLLTPRKFTTMKLIKKLTSYKDFVNLSGEAKLNNFQFMLQNKELLVSKPLDSASFKQVVLFRYNSRKFKESLSIQSPVQLFLEQIISSGSKCIDREFLNDIDTEPLVDISEPNRNQLLGRLTFVEAFQKIKLIVQNKDLTLEDLLVVYKSKITNDPLTSTCHNIEFAVEELSSVGKESYYSQKLQEYRQVRSFLSTPHNIITALLRLIETGVEPGEDTVLYSDVTELYKYFVESGLQSYLADYNFRHKNDPTLYVKEQLSIWTEVLQILYLYTTQINKRNMSILLPKRAYSLTDFLLTLKGSLQKDKLLINYKLLFSPLKFKAKGITKLEQLDTINTAESFFRSLTTFMENYVKAEYRANLILQIIKNCSIGSNTVSELYDLVRLNCPHQFMALLNLLGDLEEQTVKSYISNIKSVSNAWIKEQSFRQGMIGEFDVIYYNLRSSLEVKGNNKTFTDMIFYYQSGLDLNQLIAKDLDIMLNKLRYDMKLDQIEFNAPLSEDDNSLYFVKTWIRGIAKYSAKYLKDITSTDLMLCPISLHITKQSNYEFNEILDANLDNKSCRYFKINESLKSYQTSRRGPISVLLNMKGDIDALGTFSLSSYIRFIAGYQGMQKPNFASLLNFIDLFSCRDTTQTLIETPSEIKTEIFCFDDTDLDIEFNFDVIFKMKVRTPYSSLNALMDIINNKDKFLQYMTTNEKPKTSQEYHKNINILTRQFQVIQHMKSRLGFQLEEDSIFIKLLHLYSLGTPTHLGFHDVNKLPEKFMKKDKFLELDLDFIEKNVMVDISLPNLFLERKHQTEIKSVFDKLKSDYKSLINKDFPDLSWADEVEQSEKSGFSFF
ncbi:RNA-dependent RNA polymerase [Tai virus]|uniref:RNA-directed RNA polymerase L n=1 Tax=Tai virus TaxID=1406343 RepID=U5LXQ3_9VIRU|nr:RNA-dependent RNA polymerase [Tai virus]AGX32057.1 RNA-dependent RNA polymerase [Tai virus]